MLYMVYIGTLEFDYNKLIFPDYSCCIHPLY